MEPLQKKRGLTWPMVGILSALMVFVFMLFVFFPTPYGSHKDPKLQARMQCMGNVFVFTQMKDQWAARYHKSPTDIPTFADLLGPEENRVLKVFRCRSGGTYTLGSVGTKPRCSIASHTL